MNYMKKLLLFSVLLCVHIACIAQNEKEKNGNYYQYFIVSYAESIDNKDFTVNIDDGETIDYSRNEDGKKAHFRTPAAALLYFESKGWELVTVGTSPKGGGDFLTYWIFKKACSKEEYDKKIVGAKR